MTITLIPCPHCGEQIEVRTVSDAADLTKLKPKTIAYHVREGNLPWQQPGRDYLFTTEQLLEWMPIRRLPGRPKRKEEENDLLNTL